MDYYNFDPNIADSLLDRELRASKTGIGIYRDFSSELTIDRWLMKDPSKLELLYAKPASLQRSLAILPEKPQDLEVGKQYSKLSFEDFTYKNSIHKAKPPQRYLREPTSPRRRRPVIRVTVIPINTAHNKRHKQRFKNRKFQSTVSNTETSIKATDGYLILEGEQKKVCGVRSVGSELSNGLDLHKKNEDVVVDNNLPSLLKSLDMDGKKKKKGKKEKEEKCEENFSLMEVFEASDSPKLSLLKECMCPGESNVNTRRSRVRISGKIGLTEDDRYVLKCNATIDGKPVETNPLEQPRHSQSPPRCPAWRSPELEEAYSNTCPGDGMCQMERQQNVTSKEAFAQANITFEQTCPALITTCPAFRKAFTCPANSKPCPAQRSEETQCNPMSFNSVCISNIDKLKIVSSTRDEYMQCNCIPEKNPTNIGIGTEFDKNINSPLVIISVYPKSSEMPEDKSASPEQLDAPVEKAPKQKGGKKGKKKEGGARSRSASPAKTPSKSKAEKAPKAKKEKTGADNKGVKGKKGGKKEKGAKGTTKDKSRSPSPDKQSLQSGQKSPTFGKTGVGGGRCTECCMGCTGMSGQMHKAEQTRSRQQTKRMMNWVSAKDEESNVAININGENEFYDVIFKQGGMSTDVRVRKTKQKGKPPARIHNIDNALSDSLENFLLLSDEQKERRRSFSQTFLHQNELHINGSGNNGVKEDQLSAPPLKVRDSIEISHRREEKASDSSVKYSNSSSSSSANIHFAIAAETSVKHYHGDNCDVGNPVERDKEIRELLGIDKPRPSTVSRKYFKENNELFDCPRPRISHHINGNHRSNETFSMTKPSAATNFLQNVTNLNTSGNVKDKSSIQDNVHKKGPFVAFNNKKGINLSGENTTSTHNTSSDNRIHIATSDSRTAIYYSQPHVPNIASNVDPTHIPKPTTQKQSSASKNFKSLSSITIQSQQSYLYGYVWHRAKGENQHLQGARPTTRYTWQPASDNSYENISHLHSTLYLQHKETISRSQRDQTPQELFSLKPESQVHQRLQQIQKCLHISDGSTQTPQQYERTYFSAKRKSNDQQKDPNYNQNYYYQSRSKKVTQQKLLLREYEQQLKNRSKQQQITSDNCGRFRNHISTKDKHKKIEVLLEQRNNIRYIPEVPIELKQTAKSKPIALTRKQYVRIKKIIEYANLKKKCYYVNKRPSVTIGEVRLKRRCVSTSPVATSKGNQCTKSKQINSQPPLQSEEQYKELKWIKRPGEKLKCDGKGDAEISPTRKKKIKTKTVDTKNYVAERNVTSHGPPSVTDVYRADVEFKHMGYVRHHVKKPSLVNKLLKSSSSIHTLFKGTPKSILFLHIGNRKLRLPTELSEFYEFRQLTRHRNKYSPNLGTSANSLRSEYTDSHYHSEIHCNDQRPQKPLLRRLMSCLVMRSKVEVADKKRQAISDKRRKPVSTNSSDWYHISTSLGAMELTSSLYDTSTSFYSNHSIRPTNTNTKSGFLKSVRVLLANRRT